MSKERLTKDDIAVSPLSMPVSELAYRCVSVTIRPSVMPLRQRLTE